MQNGGFSLRHGRCTTFATQQKMPERKKIAESYIERCEARRVVCRRFLGQRVRNAQITFSSVDDPSCSNAGRRRIRISPRLPTLRCGIRSAAISCLTLYSLMPVIREYSAMLIVRGSFIGEPDDSARRADRRLSSPMPERGVPVCSVSPRRESLAPAPRYGRDIARLGRLAPFEKIRAFPSFPSVSRF